MPRLSRPAASVATHWLGAAVAVLVACNQAAITLLPDRARTPPAIRDACMLAEQRCTRCHDLERIKLAHWALVDWRYYVDRMRRQPGSGISEGDGQVILGCLEYMQQQQRDQAAMGH